MTRKTFCNKMIPLIIATHKQHETGNIGNAIKHLRAHCKDWTKIFGSYENAWNCEAILWARKHYLNETIQERRFLK